MSAFEFLAQQPPSVFAAAWRESTARLSRGLTSLQARFDEGWRQTTEQTRLWRRGELNAAAAGALSPWQLLQWAAETVAPVSGRTLRALAAAAARPELRNSGFALDLSVKNSPTETGGVSNSSRGASSATVSDDDSDSDDDDDGDGDESQEDEELHFKSAAALPVYRPQRREFAVGFYGGDKLSQRLEFEAKEFGSHNATEDVVFPTNINPADRNSENDNISTNGSTSMESSAGSAAVSVPDPLRRGVTRIDIRPPVSHRSLQALHGDWGHWAGPGASEGYSCAR